MPVIMEMQIEATTRCHYTPIGMARIQNAKTTTRWRGCGGMRTLHGWWERNTA